MGLVQSNIETAVETSPQLIESLHMAREVALKSNVAEVLPVHLVLAMLEDDESSFLLEAYGVDFKKLRSQLGRIVQKQVRPKTTEKHAVFSPGIEMIMQHARQQAQKNALGEVDSNLILAVILSERTGFLEKLLLPFDLDMSGVLQYLELREGKTVHMDPLPSLQNRVQKQPINQRPRPVAKAPASAPAPARAPLSAPAPIPRAPHPVQSAVPNKSAPPVPSNAMPTGARPNPAPALAPTPMQAPAPNGAQPPAAMRSSQPGTPAGVDNLTAALNQAFAKPGAPVPPNSPAPARAPAPASPPGASLSPAKTDTDEAPTASRFRSMIGKIGQVMSGNANPEADTREADQNPRKLTGAIAGNTSLDETAQPQPAVYAEPASIAPGSAAATLAPTPANNNQSAPPHATNLLDAPRPAPAPANDQLQDANNPDGKGQTTRQVDRLVNRPDAVDGQAENAAHAEARTNLHTNRRTKRRRAAAAGTGANQSLSATGSVLEKGRLVENVPRRMKVNNSCKAEVRITRAQMEEINSEFDDLSLNHIHDLAVTEAMTVQLRAPGSGFHIENLSPQTQWIDRNQRHINDSDFGVWRWNVTPTNSGKARLQLVISARTVDDEGTIHIADIPDKIIELAVYRDHARILKRVGLVTLVAISGVALGRFGETALQWVAKMASQLG